MCWFFINMQMARNVNNTGTQDATQVECRLQNAYLCKKFEQISKLNNNFSIEQLEQVQKCPTSAIVCARIEPGQSVIVVF